jgi:hypothetical protein
MIAALVMTGAHFDPCKQLVSTADLFDHDVSLSQVPARIIGQVAPSGLYQLIVY